MRQGPYHFQPGDQMPDLPPNPRLRRRQLALGAILAVVSLTVLLSFYSAGKFAIANDPRFLLSIAIAFAATFLAFAGIAAYRRDPWFWLITACMFVSVVGLFLIYLGFVQ